MSDNHKQFQSVKQYFAPTEGYYRVKCEVTTVRPTGKFQTIRNPERRWWQIWLPEFIEKEIYETVKEMTGEMVVYLKEGECTKWPIVARIG